MQSSTKPDPTKLNARNVQLSDLQHFPGMTGWFKPALLSKLLLKVIVSDVFGQYADRRLIQAALDPASDEEIRQRADVSQQFVADQDSEIWIDYVSDLGDGFDATYAIAYLLSQPALNVDGHDLPRGRILVMGGDEVYPTSLRDDYTVKLRLPYSFASPDTRSENSRPLFLLPGNHDWYDGLVNFLAIFCRQKTTRVGSWRTRQRRSYFALKLSEHWWIWAIDIALVRDMDQPQADYFVKMAHSMAEGANIILCSAEPGWYKAESNGDSYRTLSYAAWIAENAGKNLRMPLILSGDTHHYARYSGRAEQYITSGGGGAFLHGTLDLKDEIPATWLRHESMLSLKTSPDAQHNRCEKQACYPTQEKSRKLLLGNLKFFALNPDFSLMLGALYAAMIFALPTRRWDGILIEFLILFVGFASYTGYQERFTPRVWLLSGLHAFAHLAAILCLFSVVRWAANLLLPYEQWHWISAFLLTMVVAIPLGGAIAGTIFGLNLLLTCRLAGINHNDAFSAMRLDSHRNFLRICIQNDTIKVFPIAIDRVPLRSEWREHPNRTTDPSASVFIPPASMVPRLIEGPVEIVASRAPSTSEVAPTSELPTKSHGEK